MLLTWVAALMLFLVMGLLAIFKGWIPPWLRGREASARLYGTGVLCMGPGFGVQRLAFTVGAVLSAAGLVVILWSQPHRRASRNG
jgi:hypothetical protein